MIIPAPKPKPSAAAPKIVFRLHCEARKSYDCDHLHLEYLWDCGKTRRENDSKAGSYAKMSVILFGDPLLDIELLIEIW
jgi:hypothetical protein